MCFRWEIRLRIVERLARGRKEEGGSIYKAAMGFIARVSV